MKYDVEKSDPYRAARLSVAPMMDWTDRHCRYFHRILSKNTLLYTEMVTSPALIRGGALHLLDYDETEHPVAVQLGGSDPEELRAATKLCVDHGYDEVNLNVGCPSDRVQSGTFGAILMRDPELVVRLVNAMQNGAGNTEVTVKCRIGVDDQIPEETLFNFVQQLSDAGLKRLTIHARKAWLKGLSPKENRDIPPLHPQIVHDIKTEFNHLHISINGGITNLTEAKAHLNHLDGVMIGRAAYHDPTQILLDADEQIFGTPATNQTAHDAVLSFIPYVENQLAKGVKLSAMTRHLMGLFNNRPGARKWRRYLSENACKPGAGAMTLETALSFVPETSSNSNEADMP